jgi:hypothetical protein
MDKALRNTLRNVVTQCRKLLEEAVGEVLQGQFGIHADGKVEDASRLILSDEDLRYRDEVVAHLDHIRASGLKAKDAAEQLIREAAFTHLNRLCAYKMMTARGLIDDPVGKGLKSRGFMFYLADHSADEALYGGAKEDVAFRHYLDFLNEQLSADIGVLFSKKDLATRLFPPHRVLVKVLDQINSDELASVWAEDETIGWVYQYFTPKEIRDSARKESRAPRNSYELAFRNQFYTPRYVVAFLVDNTLGRLWYEMRKGETSLKKKLQYLVRRPTEIFLSDGEEQPNNNESGLSQLSNEELLKQQVYIKHREKKDPREIKILDPACGSGHFLLYCFEVLQTIYDEAYDDAQLGPALRSEYPTNDEFKCAIPRLILENNLHGIDIDLRSTQISALALWLRAQRAYRELGIEKDLKLHIRKTNVACAEPMPGEHELLEEFLKAVYPPFLADVVRVVFDNMKLAGEAGSLLRIDEKISGAISQAKKHWRAIPQQQQLALFRKEKLSDGKQGQLFDLSGITDDEFWNEAEARVLESLNEYAQSVVGNGQGLRRRLFAQDATQGFAFVDISQKRFDVILMNPPFGEASRTSKTYIDANYPNTKGDLLANFIERTLQLSLPTALIGAISSRTCFYLRTFESLREKVLSRDGQVCYMVDLGDGVLEAMVETAMYTIRPQRKERESTVFVRCLLEEDKSAYIVKAVDHFSEGQIDENIFLIQTEDFSRLSASPYCYWISRGTIELLSKFPRLEGNVGSVRVGLQTGKDSRFLRLIWEVPAKQIAVTSNRDFNNDDFVRNIRSSFQNGKRWAFYSKTDTAAPWISPLTLVVDWDRDGKALKEFIRAGGDSPSRSVRSETLYFLPGFSYMLRSTRLVPCIIPSGVIPTAGRSQVYPAKGEEISLLGLCASNVVSAVLRFSGGKFAWPVFQASMIQNIPVAELPHSLVSQLSKRIEKEFDLRRSGFEGHEPFLEFIRPALLDANARPSTSWNLLSLLGADLESEIGSAYNLSTSQLTEVERDIREAIAFRETRESGPSFDEEDEADESTDIESVDDSSPARAQGLVSYLMGSLFGRWDIRIAGDVSLVPKRLKPFDPLPPCPLGTLVGVDGLPATKGGIVSERWLRNRPDAISLPALNSTDIATISDSDYPIEISWDGLLPDDPTHDEDILASMSQALEKIVGDMSTALEEEVIANLSFKSLRDYLRKASNGGFWMDHVKRYSKSRRKAPIYWYLRSSKGNYGLWLYYHRLDKDIYHKARVHYVEPKLRLEENNLAQLRQRKGTVGTTGREAKQLEKELEKQESFISELHAFNDKLKRVADLNLEPDLNDGVVLNIAVLHELVPWTEAKKYWKELLEGKYEWSTIAKQLCERGLVKQ